MTPQSPWVTRALGNTLPASAHGAQAYTSRGRWVPICADCWYVVFPDQYAPYHESRDFAESCAVCGEDTLANIHVNPADLA